MFGSLIVTIIFLSQVFHIAWQKGEQLRGIPKKKAHHFFLLQYAQHQLYFGNLHNFEQFADILVADNKPQLAR